jgi:hypothetical protein
MGVTEDLIDFDDVVTGSDNKINNSKPIRHIQFVSEDGLLASSIYNNKNNINNVLITKINITTKLQISLIKTSKILTIIK